MALADNTYAARLVTIMECYDDMIVVIGRRFGDEETRILRLLKQTVVNFSDMYAVCGAKLLMSWASDAQHDIAFDYGENEVCDRPEITELNNMKRELLDTILIPHSTEYGHVDYEVEKQFRRDFTWNY